MDEALIQETAKLFEPREIGGWLIFVAIGLIFAPIGQLYTLFNVNLPVLTNGTWEALTTEGTAYYSPFWSIIISSEIVLNILVLMASGSLIYLFFKKKTSFPKIYAFVMIFSTLFLFADALVVSWMLPETTVFNSEVTTDIIRSVIGCAIWVPYMFISERAKETFIVD